MPNRLTFLLIIAVSVVLLLKLLFGAILDLYSDEIFYWQASTRPAAAYSDLPFMTALLAGLGSSLFGYYPIAVRAAFIAMGTSIPLLVYWLARPMVGRQQAIESALLSLCLPLGAFLGLLAVPDVPLVFFGLLFIGFLERATRLDTMGLWLATGVIAALGLSTHYRFVLYPLAGLLYFLLLRSQRKFLLEPRLWVAVAVMSIGLVPTIRFNLTNDLAGLEYHLLDRHPWNFQAEGLLHVFKQAVLVTPPLYLVLLLTLYQLVKRAVTGDDRRGLIACFALLHLGVFLLLAPWTDSTRTSIHWPVSGYLPLLVFLPNTLRSCTGSNLRYKSSLFWRRTAKIAPAIGFTGTLIAFIGIGSQAFNSALQPILGPDVLSNKMAGWKPFNNALTEILRRHDGSSEFLIVTDNYYTAAQVEFGAGRGMSVYNIDNDKAYRDGRAAQFLLWGSEESGIRRRSGESAILITEDSTLTLEDKMVILNRACSLFEEVKFLEQLVLFNGDKSFSFYMGSKIVTADHSGQLQPITGMSVCPVPSRSWLDSPPPDSQVKGTISISGWAANDGGGIKSLHLLANGQQVAELTRNLVRLDVIDTFNIRHDPEQPNVGFAIEFDTSQLPNGRVELALEAIANSGEVQRFRPIPIRVDNQ